MHLNSSLGSSYLPQVRSCHGEDTWGILTCREAVTGGRQDGRWIAARIGSLEYLQGVLLLWLCCRLKCHASHSQQQSALKLPVIALLIFVGGCGGHRWTRSPAT
jgi:hypothetical protein